MSYFIFHFNLAPQPEDIVASMESNQSVEDTTDVVKQLQDGLNGMREVMFQFRDSLLKEMNDQIWFVSITVHFVVQLNITFSIN